MLKLAEAKNTYSPALLTLRAKGYQLRTRYESDQLAWIAERHDVTLYAYDPLALLGLAALWEVRGPGWQRSGTEPQLHDEITAKAAEDLD